MKTFKQHIKEDQSKYGKGSVGTPEVQAVDDVHVGAHNIHDQKVMEKVNAFVGSIADQEYLDPKAAMEQLANKLATIGLSFKVPDSNKIEPEVVSVPDSKSI